MKLKIVRLLLLMLALCMSITTAVACNRSDEKEKETESDTVEDVSDDVYPFPDSIELADKELNIYNFSEYYNAIIYTDTDDYSDKIPQEVYDRNAYFADRYGIDVIEHQLAFTTRTVAFAESTTTLSNNHFAGDDIYDIAYVSLNEQYTLISTGVMRNLAELSTIDLTADWWDPQLSKSYVLKDGACYVASSPLNLMPYELTWLVFFNQALAEERGLPDLFEYVRNGEWTIETMLKTVRDYGVITENAEGGYTFDANGTAVYGVAVHSAGAPKLLTGFDITFIQEKDDAVVPYKFACSSTDDFAKANEWLLQLFDRNSGMAIGTDVEDDLVNSPDGYVPVFQAGRSLFLHAELKSGMTMKKVLNSSVNYGMLPQPKLDAEQTNYYTTTGASVMLLGIPTINDEAEAAGAAADVLSYLSYRDVLPVYYDDYVSFRNVSDPDSLDMLDNYIMPGRRLEIGVAYGWTATFMSAYAPLIYKQQSTGAVTLANIVSVNTKTTNSLINKFFTGSN